MVTFTILASIVPHSDYPITVKRSLCQDGPSNWHPGRRPSKTLYVPSFYHRQPTPVSPPRSLSFYLLCINQPLSPPRTRPRLGSALRLCRTCAFPGGPASDSLRTGRVA